MRQTVTSFRLGVHSSDPSDKEGSPCPIHTAQMPKGTDSTFAAKLQQQQAAHPRFSYNQRAPGDDFTIQV